MVAETLRFGDSKGGVGDLMIATKLTTQLLKPTKQRDFEEYLRFVILFYIM